MGMQVGDFIKRAESRLKRLSQEGVTIVEIDINPKIPLNTAVTTLNGTDVCWSHINPIVPMETKPRLEIPQEIPPGLLR